MERFTMDAVTDGERAWCVADPHPDGEWVKASDAQAETIARLAEALKPFSEFVATIEKHPEARKCSDDFVIHPGITVGDFRRARAALKGEAQ